MPAPEYRLQALLELRQRATKQAEDRLAATHERRETVHERLQLLRAEKQGMIQQRLQRQSELTRKMQDRGLSTAEVQAEYRVLERMAGEVKAFDDVLWRQEQELQACEIDCQQALEALVETRKELDLIEKHKQKWLQEMHAELQRQERDRADGVREPLVHLGSLASQGQSGRKSPADGLSDEIPGLDVTLENLRREGRVVFLDEERALRARRASESGASRAADPPQDAADDAWTDAPAMDTEQGQEDE